MTDTFMAEALAEARRSLDLDEFPAGAVLVRAGEVVTRAHWRGIGERRLLDHAELVALLDAERTGSLSTRAERQEATLYTTLEPCALCMAAAMSFLLGRVVFALDAPVDGGANLAELWKPRHGHPANGVPYALPHVGRGPGGHESAELIARWIERAPEQRAWASPYVEAAAAPQAAASQAK